MSVKLLWVTPDAENQIMRMARVSSNNRDSENTKLLSYLIKNKHFSPLEMGNMCVEIEGDRAILRQILRHRSFHFQEFSQRYAKVTNFTTSEARRQDTKNRQNSINDLSPEIQEQWEEKQKELNLQVEATYEWALENGVAKECARSVLPEGNTTSILCMNGTLRSWIHYFDVRCGSGTQKEHIDIANQIRDIFREQFPIIAEAC
tara:strand:+ start:437 stop:1048 length:612 start_codon:yes stop_codon:yes gene_type:complete